MPLEVCNIFQRSASHSQPTRKRVPQVVPPKDFDLRFNHRVVESMPPVLTQLCGFFRLEHTPLPIAPRAHNPKGGYGSIV
jgi:hypothetical protein